MTKGRAAGNSPFYRLGILNQADQVTGKIANLWSVTTILKAIDKPLTWWGYKLGIQALREIVENDGLQMQEAFHVPAVDYEQPVLRLSDDELYEKIKARKAITPSTVRDTAGVRGTSIHDVVEGFFVDNKLPDPANVPAELHPYVRAFVKWSQDFLGDAVDHRVILCEHPVYSLRYEYVGTCDLAIYKDGLYYVIDFKTSKALYSDTLLQPIAYLNAIGEMSERARRVGRPDDAYFPDAAPCQCLVVALHDDETYEVGYANEFELTFKDFLAVYEMFLLKQKLDGIGDTLKSRRKEQVSASV